MSGNPPKREPTGDYDVGYCRPPLATRWQAGECGRSVNRGKPKTPKKAKKRPNDDIVDIIRRQLREPLTDPHGNKLDIDFLTYIARMLINDMSKGTPTQRLRLFKELYALGVLQPGPDDHQIDPDMVVNFITQLAEASGLKIDEKGDYYDPTDPPGQR
jgi:hypothetical protein